MDVGNKEALKVPGHADSWSPEYHNKKTIGTISRFLRSARDRLSLFGTDFCLPDTSQVSVIFLRLTLIPTERSLNF